VAEVVDYLKVSGGFKSAVGEVFRRRMTVEAAKKHGLTVSAKELQKEADIFRAERGMHKAIDTKNWLASNGLSVEAFEQFLETNLLISKFKDALGKRANLKRCHASSAVRDCVRSIRIGGTGTSDRAFFRPRHLGPWTQEAPKTSACFENRVGAVCQTALVAVRLQ
jgi:hypothetical protein